MKTLGLALLIFAASVAVYNASPGKQEGDPYYSMLLSENLLLGRGFALDEYFAGELDPRDHPQLRANALPYQIIRSGEHLYYFFPAGSSILSLPLVGLIRASGVSTLDEYGTYRGRGERRMQRRIAPLVAASFAVLAFLTARLLLSAPWSVVVALCVAFGTQLWSSVAMAAWSHGWFLVLLGAAVLHLLAAEQGRTKLRPLLLGTLMAWCYFARPTGLLPLAGIGAYLLLRERAAAWNYGAVVVGWLALFAGHSWWLHGALLPPYYRAARLGSATFVEALAGNLFSPGRGVLIFVPQLLVVAWLLLRHRRSLQARALVSLSWIMIAIHWIVISSYAHWWAGYSYGPRLMTDVLPWQLLLGVIALGAWLDERARRTAGGGRRALAGALAASILAFAFMVHAGGALSKRSMRWNAVPVSVDEAPRERLWDWSDPQFLAWTRPELDGPSR